MLNNKLIAVVVPCYNEEKQISIVIESMPNFVDRIVIVNDGSTDNTCDVVLGYAKESSNKKRIRRNKKIKETIYNKADILLNEIRTEENKYYSKHTIVEETKDKSIVLINQENSGVGSAIAVGYKWCRDNFIDCTAVMAGDGQMDPNELINIVKPVIEENIDYVKGNRLSHPASKHIIPKIRYFGNSVLSLMTKIASGYWHVSDTQTGYTAISLNALNKINIYDIYPKYGCPNDILVKLNIENCTLKEIQIKPVYNVGEKSKMKIAKVIPTISFLLLKSFFIRMWNKYFIRNFHPLFIFYMFGIFTSIVNIPIFIKLFIEIIIKNGSVTLGWYITFVLLSLFSFQSIGFGMYMDMQDNIKLEKY